MYCMIEKFWKIKSWKLLNGHFIFSFKTSLVSWNLCWHNYDIITLLQIQSVMHYGSQRETNQRARHTFQWDGTFLSFCMIFGRETPKYLSFMMCNCTSKDDGSLPNIMQRWRKNVLNKLWKVQSFIPLWFVSLSEIMVTILSTA